MVGGGDGGVLREVVKHPMVEEVCLCEIDEVWWLSAWLHYSQQKNFKVSTSYYTCPVRIEDQFLVKCQLRIYSFLYLRQQLTSL